MFGRKCLPLTKNLQRMYMKRRFPIVLLLTLAVCITSVLAQGIHLLPRASQLPGPVIRRIVQDPEGYMWYGTTDWGLCRDNGYQIDHINTPGEASTEENGHVNDLCATADGRVAWATRAGAWLLDKRDYGIKAFKALCGKDVASIVADISDGSFWATAGDTLYHFDREQHLIKRYAFDTPASYFKELSLYIDSQGHHWLMEHSGGLRVLNTFTDRFEACEWPADCSPTAMCEDTVNHCLWVGTMPGGVVRYDVDADPRRSTATRCASGLAFVTGLCPSTNGRLWIATLDGLWSLNSTPNSNGTVEAFSGGRGVSRSGGSAPLSGITNRPIIDRHGNVWVPSFSPETFFITQPEGGVQRYDVAEMLQATGYPLVADAMAWENEGCWIMQSKVGLTYWRDGKLSLYDTGQKGLSLPIENMLERCANQSGVWALTDGFLVHVWMENGRMLSRRVVHLEQSVTSLVEDRCGLLLLGTNDGCLLVDVSTGHTERVGGRLGYVSDICCGTTGDQYLLSSLQGIVRLQADGNTEVLSDNTRFDRIDLAPDGTLWLSASDGKVAHLDTKTLKLQEMPEAGDGLGFVIKRMCVDGRGHVWTLTSRYIKDYDPTTRTFRIFRHDNDDIRADYLQDLCMDASRRVWFCGAGGIFATLPVGEFPRQEEAGTEPMFPTICNISIDGTRSPLCTDQTQLEVPASVASIGLYLTTFDHAHAETVTFAYRLTDGSTHDNNAPWTYLPTGSNVVQLAGLTPGTYGIELMAIDRQGHLQRSQQTFIVHKLPAWWQTWWAKLAALALAIIIIAVAVRIYLRAKTRRGQEEMEHRLVDMKMRFFTNVSHELRTPLTLIITPLQSIIASLSEQKTTSELSTSAIIERLTPVLSHAQGLLELIGNLLSFRKLETGMMQLHLRYGSLTDFVGSEVEAMRILFDRKEIHVEYHPTDDPLNIHFDKTAVHHILFNLLSNALKFTSPGGNVMVETSRPDTEHVNISVKDNGAGISPEQLPHIFERFYQAEAGKTHSQGGSGIGLNMVYELAKMHGGTVHVQSQLGQGTQFDVTIPILQKDGGIQETTPSAVENDETTPSRTVPTILFAEDNDDLRQFVAHELRHHFRVLLAANGDEAQQLAQQETVDIVVSDIIMPLVDGIELCRRLKKDSKTSHIPIVLLTARSADEAELEAYRVGADHYITKPFDMKVLNSLLQRIEQQQREHRQKLMQTLENPDIDALFTTEHENQFMKKLIALLDKHIADENYSVETLSMDLCMSYATAYRKVKALTGQTPAEFIRSYRLRRATTLLRSTNRTIAVIAQQTGFTSPAYFARCFAKEYGPSPSEYRNAEEQKKH